MSKISWTEQTWNPIVGCSKVSPGCANCYAERMACRLAEMACSPKTVVPRSHMIDSKRAYTGVVDMTFKPKKDRAYWTHWNSKTAFVESALDKPLKRKKPTTYFVCSMGDLFHESVPFEWIDKVFAVMALCPDHTFQVLTKRPERMAEYFDTRPSLIWAAVRKGEARETTWPFQNVWLGTTAENQEMADKRIPHLLKCPAAKRFVSVEPMLEAVDLTKIVTGEKLGTTMRFNSLSRKGGIAFGNGGIGLDWVICGCESGPGARPMKLEWARSLRDQCKAAGVPFFMKQLTISKKLIKNIEEFPEDLRIREYPK